jgi:thiol-disulfide isomerase/thioredoxin
MKISLALTLAAVAGLAALASTQSGGLQTLKGRPMPSFTMTDTNGKRHTNASLRGKVVLLDFWASWCGPCKAASPIMQRLHERFAKDGLVVVGANVEPDDSVADIKGYASKNGYTYTFTHSNQALSRQLGVRGIPAFVFVDRKGVVREVAIGFDPDKSEAAFTQKVRQLLAAR